MGRKKTIICPRCKQEEKAKGMAYCRKCKAEYQRERYSKLVGGTPGRHFDWCGLGLGKAYGSYKHNCARKRGREWGISKELFMELSQMDCEYCGAAPANQLSGRMQNKAGKDYWVKETGWYNGLDRVDNSMGYTPDNVVTCCAICNRMKRDLPVDEFYAHLRKILARAR